MAKKTEQKQVAMGSAIEHEGVKYQTLRDVWWSPWGENGQGPGAVLAGVIERLFMGSEKKIGGRTLAAQYCLSVQTADGEVLSVGCSSSLAWQLCEKDKDGEIVGWKEGVRPGRGIFIRYDGEGKAKKGQSAPHLFTVGLATDA